MGRLKNGPQEAEEGAKRPLWYRRDLSGVVFTKHKPELVIDITRLASTDREAWNQAWSCIKRNRPGLAELLKDPNLKTIADHFGGSIQIQAHAQPTQEV